MPSEARRLHAFTVVSRALRLARQLLLPAIVGGVSIGGDAEGTLTLVLLILSVPSLLVAVAQWLAFRFRLDGDELILDSGVLSRRRRVIPVARIQNADLAQSFLERIAGMARLRLETASGGRETEAVLEVLPLAEARTFQTELLRRRAAARQRLRADAAPHADAHADAAAFIGDASRLDDDDASRGAPAHAPTPPAHDALDPPAPRPRELLRLSVPDLAIAGATSNEAGLIAAGLATLLQLADDLGSLDRIDGWLEALLARGAGVGIAGAAAAMAIVVVVFIVAGWLVSVVATMVRFHGFTLTRVGEDLRREYGLFARHHSTVPLERVQAIRIEETLLRRALGLAALKIETAGAGPRQRGDGPGGGAEAFVPIARRGDVERLLREVFEDARFQGVILNPVAPVSQRRGFVRLALPIAGAAALLAALVSRSWLALLLLLAPAALLARAQYRARGWARPAGYALARLGVFTRVTWVVPARKIQTLHARETPFQRRWRLATLLIDTAAGGRVARVVDLDRDVATALLVELAGEAESARRAALPGAG